MASRFDWEAIRAEYEAGATQSDIARRHGCSRTAIQKRIEAEGWLQDLEPVIERLTAAKVAGVVAGCNPQKKAVALATEADRRAAVALRHRTEWDSHQTIIDQALTDRDFELAKLAKITAETLRIRQDSERKAWGLETTTKPEPATTPVFVIARENSKDNGRPDHKDHLD
jgi:transposase-like protein